MDILKEKERKQLEGVMAYTQNAKELRRAQALVWHDDGESVQEIGERLRVSQRTIYNWIARFEQRSRLDISARLLDGQRRAADPQVPMGLLIR